MVNPIEDKRLKARAGRIRHAFEYARVKQKDIASACGISPTAVNKWTRDGKLDTENLFILSKMTGFTAQWIFEGEGPKHAMPSVAETVGTYDFRNQALLAIIIEGLQETVDRSKEKWTVKRIVQEVMDMYDHFHDYEQEITSKNVTSLLSYTNKKR